MDCRRLNSFMMHSVVFRQEAIWFISSSIILHTPSTQTLRFLSNNFLSSCKCVLCLFDFICVTACVLAVLLLQVSIHPYQCVKPTYEFTLKLLDSLLDPCSKSWEHILGLLEGLLLHCCQSSSPLVNYMKLTSCLSVYSLFSSPSLASSFLMRSSCCTNSLW